MGVEEVTIITTDEESVVALVETQDGQVSVLTVGGAGGDVEVLTVEGDAGPTLVVTQGAQIYALTIKDRGPQGIPGIESGGLVSYPVAYAMSGHRIVVVGSLGSVLYASKDVALHANKVLGMTTEAVISGDILIQTGGVIVESSWSWTLDIPIWLSVDGLMAQITPTSGFSLIVGFPITATSMCIDIREPIVLV